MTSPPKNAPSALATFKAAWFRDEASEGASGEASRRRVCSAGISMDPEAPTTNTITRADQGQCTAMAYTTSATAIAGSTLYSVPITDLSAILPPTTLPATMPSPYKATTSGISDDGRPATCVMVWEMYV